MFWHNIWLSGDTLIGKLTPNQVNEINPAAKISDLLMIREIGNWTLLDIIFLGTLYNRLETLPLLS